MPIRPYTRRLSWLVGAVAAASAGGCFLVGYDALPEKASGRDAGGSPSLIDALPPAGEAGVPGLDGSAGLDARVVEDTGTGLDATGRGSPDATSFDATAEAGVSECTGEAGCTCPPNGTICAGDLWLTCDGQGRVVDSVDCRSQVMGACVTGVCEPGMGCTSQPARDGTACDDGLFCTAVDACSKGTCVGSSDPCTDGVCLNQSCDETSKSCTVDKVNVGTACGTGFTCAADGSCSADTNCSGTCTPACSGSQSKCDLSCHDATSCDVNCGGSQTCNTNCKNTQTCATSCDSLLANCNLDCTAASTCTGRCVGGDCALVCDSAGSCQNSCSGAYSDCTTSCNGASSCSTSCSDLASCGVTGCQGGVCSAACTLGSNCSVNCQSAKSCSTSCAFGSSCTVDCTGAASCQVACSFTSQCLLKCSPNDPLCAFTECAGGATRCKDGSLACHTRCPP